MAGRKLETKVWWYDFTDRLFLVDEKLSRSWCWFHTRRFNINETRPECIKAVNTVAATCGYLDVLKHWENVPADKKKVLWDETACRRAAFGGHLDVLKYLRSQGCPWDSWTCDWAAQKGHLKVLKWARHNGCPWSKWSCTWAAEDGHLDVLKWLRSQKPPCPWNKRVCLTWAQQNNHSHVVAWINAQP